MDELIWVGNTLYPRWFVVTVALAILLTPFVLVCAFRVARFVRRVFR